MANEYDINYDDQRFKDVETQKQAALTESENLYGGMVNESEKYYQAQIDASKQWADKQTQLQQEKTDFAIDKIEQQKDQAKKDYTKEQSGAYVDWQKQSNQYGANAEQMASAGLTNTGFSESSQVSMYNTYQNRVATARESFNNAILNYNNAIKDAQLQNNSVLAEIAYKALEQQLELSLQGFQYKNQLLLEQANKKLEIDNNYYGRYQDVLDQINKENALAEQIRQYNESMALEREQFEWQKKQAKRSSGGGSSRSSSSSGGGGYTIDKDTSSSGYTGHGIDRETPEQLKSKSSSSNPTISTQSLIKAGYAGKSAATIAKDISSGKLKVSVSGNKATVKPSALAIANKMNYSKIKF